MISRLSSPLPNLSARQLCAVLAVADYRSFIAAAAYMQISQPALTRTIKQVEKAVGVELFTRTTRHVTTTAAGIEFVALAERLLNDLRISVGSIRRHSDVQHGQIIVASVLSLAGAIPPKLIANYNGRYPGIEIHLREGVQSAVVDDVQGGVADFGIGYTNGLPGMFQCRTLRTERLHLVFLAGNPFAAYDEINIAALGETALVSFPAHSHTRRLIDNAAAAGGINLRYTVTTNRLATLYSLVHQRIGAAIVPSSELPPSRDRNLASRPIAPHTLTSQLGIIRLRERQLNPPSASFLDIVEQWLAKRDAV
jgi:DNA-binding transcriptional LysR family regulator